MGHYVQNCHPRRPHLAQEAKDGAAENFSDAGENADEPDEALALGAKSLRVAHRSRVHAAPKGQLQTRVEKADAEQHHVRGPNLVCCPSLMRKSTVRRSFERHLKRAEVIFLPREPIKIGDSARRILAAIVRNKTESFAFPRRGIPLKMKITIKM